MMRKHTNKLPALYISVTVLFVVDRLLKWFAVNRMSKDGHYLIPDVTGLFFERNEGIAYGISINPTVLTVGVALIIGVLIYYLIRTLKAGNIVMGAALMLLTAGAISNLIDRLIYGYVVDMLVLTSWPVFNIADLMVSAGAIALVLQLLKKEKAA